MQRASTFHMKCKNTIFKGVVVSCLHTGRQYLDLIKNNTFPSGDIN
jgi:hypothetical protein